MLGAGIVGTSIALHLVKRGLAVTLIDRGEPGEGTSYGNAGIIEGNTGFPAAFPASLTELARIALEIDAGLGGGKYQATPAELAGIYRGLKAADEGRFATADQVGRVFEKHRPG